MDKPFGRDALWIAQRHGQDWRDESVLAAADWLESLVPARQWSRRAAAVETRFQAAKADWAAGRRTPLYDPADQLAWYCHQARCYGDPRLRPDFFEPEGYRIAPLFRRLGQLLPEFRAIAGAEERAARIVTGGRAQPDDGFYELLVAGAYARRGWTPAFVPELPGVAKRPDLFVDRSRAHWAVECKRAGRSGYAREERLAGERMAGRAHAISKAARRPLLVLARYVGELHALGDDYLADKVGRFVDGDGPYEWADEGGAGAVVDVHWGPLEACLLHDDIYFGSSRMIQLLLGRYEQDVDYSVNGDWTPGAGRPLHATSVEHVSLVAWRSVSAEAARRKAQHFRSVVARAARQLPGDRPGAVHVGYEAVGGNSVDGLRHRLNAREMRAFEPGQTRLRVVYGNFFMPEHVTARMESAALTETTAWYPIGSGRRRQPLPHHMLFMDEDGEQGAHF